jgi:hypothetical protein
VIILVYEYIKESGSGGLKKNETRDH